MSLKIITENITPRVVFELLKFKMPIFFIFVDNETKQINPEYTINVVDRIFNGAENIPVIKKGSFNHKTTYENIITMMNMYIQEGYAFQIMAEETDIHKYKPLLDFLGKVDEELIEIVTYIDYNSVNKYFEIRNIPDEKKNSDVIYYFVKDRTLLIFDENGPKIDTNANITNISDILIN